MLYFTRCTVVHVEMVFMPIYIFIDLDVLYVKETNILIWKMIKSKVGRPFRKTLCVVRFVILIKLEGFNIILIGGKT